MNNVIEIKSIPVGSNIVQGFGPISYADTFKLAHPLDESIDQIVTDIFTVPNWINMLMRLRNALVRPFGLQTGQGMKIKSAPYYPVGSRAMYFTVLERTENEIIMEENDGHLKFRCSVYVNNKESAVYVTTLVYFNNFFGNMYFFVIKPFHKIIIKVLLRRIIGMREARLST